MTVDAAAPPPPPHVHPAVRQRRSQAGEPPRADAAQSPWLSAGKGPRSSSRLLERAAVVVACISWVAASSGAILINKHIMVDLEFPYPSTVGALGLVGTSLFGLLATRVLRLTPPGQQPVSLRLLATHFLPTGLFLALAMQLGNTAYLYLSVSFVQMLKAFTPVVTLACGVAFRLETPTLPLLAAVGLVTAGVAAASYGGGTFSPAGGAAMVASMACEGLRLVLMQLLVSRRSLHPLHVLAALAPCAAAWMLLLAGGLEAAAIHQSGALHEVLRHPRALAASALAGFCVNVAAMAVISLASALTLKVLGVCKDIGLVLYSVVVLGDAVSRPQAAGYSVAVVGLAWYNAIKAAGTARAGGGGAGGRGSVSGVFGAAVAPRAPTAAAAAK